MGSSEGVEDEKKPHMTAYLIEKIVKQYKSHRSASDFDADFINKIVDKMREEQYTNNSKLQQRLSTTEAMFVLMTRVVFL